MINQNLLDGNKATISKLGKDLEHKNILLIKNEESQKTLEIQLSTKQNQLDDLKRELDKMVSSNMKRGEMLSKLQSEKTDVENALEKAKKEIKQLQLKWKNQLEQIDVNYRIKSLQEQLEEAREEISGLEMHKTRLKNELNAEKLLNSRLRQYK